MPLDAEEHNTAQEGEAAVEVTAEKQPQEQLLPRRGVHSTSLRGTIAEAAWAHWDGRPIGGQLRKPSSSSSLCQDVDSIKDAPSGLNSLVEQLSSGKGELFKCVDNSSIRAGHVGCAVCGKNFNDTSPIEGRLEVKILPCFHCVCGPCLQTALAHTETGQLECPICSWSESKRALHEYLPHFEAHSMIDRETMARRAFVCEECVSGNSAEAYCETCVTNLCSDCVRQHRRAKATVRHRVTNLDGMSVSRESHRAQFCHVHRNAHYELYCEDCNVPVCQQCVIESHQNHSYKLPSKHLISKLRRAMQDVVERLCTDLLGAQELHRQLDASCEAAERASLAAHAEADKAFDELLSAAKGRCSELVAELTESLCKRRQVLDMERNACSRALQDIWRTIDFLEKVISRGTNIEILQARSHMFQDRDQVTQLQTWHELAHKAPVVPWNSGDVTAGWSSHSEQAQFLRTLGAFGSFDVPPHFLKQNPAPSKGEPKKVEQFDLNAATVASESINGSLSSEENSPKEAHPPVYDVEDESQVEKPRVGISEKTVYDADPLDEWYGS